ncbi:MAG: hypothetical protein WBB82_15165 [Limnothrix sp.]
MAWSILRFGLGSVAIAAAIFSPLSVLANPLEQMEGWVYEVNSAPDVGVSQHGLPEGVVSQGGTMLGNTNAAEPYLIGFYQYDSTMLISFEQLLLQRKVQTDQGVINEQYREILDTAVVTQPESWLISCQVNGQDDPEIVAIAAEQIDIDVEWLTDFQGVWRANRTSKKLEEIPTSSVRCLNISYEYDG